MRPLPLERQHVCPARIIFGDRLARAGIVHPEHPQWQVTMAPIGPAKVGDSIPDLDAERLSDKLSTHTHFPAPRMQACGGGVGCDSVSRKSTRPKHRSSQIGLTFVAPAQRIGIAA